MKKVGVPEQFNWGVNIWFNKQRGENGFPNRKRIKLDSYRRIDAFELWCWKRLESLLDCKEIQPVHPKREGDQSWVFIARTVVEAETPLLWLRDAKS